MSGTQRAPVRDTRRHLLETFNTLVLNGTQGRITVSDIVREAGVGRSTFYDHFASADDIHQQALAGPMTLLAEAILGLDAEARLGFLLAHFQDNAQRAESTLNGAEGEKVERLLVSILNARLSTGHAPTRAETEIVAVELAAVSLALIRAWLAGTISCSSAEAAGHIVKVSAAIRKELR